MKARNEAWVSRYVLERVPYRWNLDTGELRFQRAADVVIADLCLIGTASEVAGSFMGPGHPQPAVAHHSRMAAPPDNGVIG